MISFKRNLLQPLQAHIQTVYYSKIYFVPVTGCLCFPLEYRAQISAICELKVASKLLRSGGIFLDQRLKPTIVIYEIKMAIQNFLKSKLH